MHPTHYHPPPPARSARYARQDSVDASGLNQSGRPGLIQKGATAPTIRDRLWVVPCITGKEREATLSLMNKMMHLRFVAGEHTAATSYYFLLLPFFCS